MNIHTIDSRCADIVANLRDATVAAIRLQQSLWQDDPNSAFVAKAFTAFIEEHLRENIPV